MSDIQGATRSRLRARTAALPLVGVLLLAAGLLALTTAYDGHRQLSPTMQPTIGQGDLGYFTTLEGSEDVQRGDVVRIDPDWEGAEGTEQFVFRVIGLGGDAIQGDGDGRFSVDGVAVDETYLDAGATHPAEPFEVTVPEGRLFVAGDARSISNDSTAHLDEQGGSVASSAATQRLVGVGWPVWAWSLPDTERGTPWLFVAASALVAIGSLLLLGAAWRSVLSLYERYQRRDPTSPRWFGRRGTPRAVE